MTLRPLICFLGLATVALAQSSSVSLVAGEYHYQALSVHSYKGAISQASSAQGSFSFGDGVVQVDGTATAYREAPGGFVTLGGFLEGFGSFDARAGASALMGVSSAFDDEGTALVVALKKPDAEFSTATFQGQYQAILISFPSAGIPTPFFGSGMFDASQTSLAADADGTGTLTLPANVGLGVTQFQVAFSADDRWIIGQPLNGTGLFIAANKASSALAPMSWMLEFSVDAAGPAAAIGALTSLGTGQARVSEKWVTPRGLRDFRGEAALTQPASGSGTLNATPVTVAGAGLVGGTAGTGSGLALIAFPMPDVSSSGVFAHPHGDVNAASFSPAGDPAAPGQLRSLFGTNLASGMAAAESLPLPTELLGTSVQVNDAKTPLLFVSPSQVNYRVDPDVAGPILRIVAQNGDAESEAIFTTLATTSPAVFSIDGSGIGQGIFTHLDYTLVTPQSPARRNEVIVVFLTGLGVNQPLPQILMDGIEAEVLFAGPAPGFAGLDQVNVRIPATSAIGDNVTFTIGTRDGWTDTVSIAIQP